MKTVSLIIITTILSLLMHSESDYDYNKAWNEVAVLKSKGFKIDLSVKLDEILSQAKTDKLVGEAFAAFQHKLIEIDIHEDTMWVAINKEIEGSFDKKYTALLLAEKASILQDDYYSNETDVADADPNTPPSEMGHHQKRALAFDLYLQALETKALTSLKFEDLKHASMQKGSDSLFYQSLNAYDLVVKGFLDFLESDQGLEDVSTIIYSEADLMAPLSKFTKLNFEPSKESRLVTIAALLKNLLIEEKENALHAFYIDKVRMDYFNGIFHNENSESLYHQFLIDASQSKDIDKSLLAHLQLLNQSIAKDSNYTQIIKDLTQLKQSHSKSIFYEKLEEIEKNLGAIKLKIDAKQVFFIGEDVAASLELRNASKIDYKLHSISALSLKEYASSNDDWEVKLEKLKSGAKVSLQKNEALKFTPYEKHDYKLALGKLKGGAYLLSLNVTAADGSAKTENVIFQVTDLAVSMLYGSKGNALYVNDRKSGNAVKGAKINYFSKGNRYGGAQDGSLKASSSNVEGKIIPDGRGNFGIMAVNKRDTFVTVQDMVNLYDQGKQSGGIQKQVNIYTDRAIYRPGQLVFYKVILSEYTYDEYGQTSKRRVLGGETISTTFRDANYQEIDKGNIGKTNEYGSVHGQFTIPKGLLNGYFQIETPYGGQGVKVEEYKRPAFEVLKSSIKRGATREAESTVEVQAKALAGNNITNAKVSYSISRMVSFPRCYWYMPQDNSSSIILSGVGLTDDEGKFKLAFSDKARILPEPKNKMLIYKVAIAVTDQSGETQHFEESITFSNQETFLVILSDNQIDKLDNKAFVVQAFNQDMDSIAKKVVLSVYQSKVKKSWKDDEEDYDRYIPVNAESVDLSKMVLVKKFSANAWEEIKANLDAGQYYLVAEVDGEKGNPTSKWVDVTDFKGKNFPTASLLYLKANKLSFEPGSKLEVLLGSEEKIYVRWILMRGSYEIHNELVKVSRTKKLEYKIEEKDRGGLSMFFNVIKENHFETNQLQIDVPWSNKVLDVKIESFRDKILPGSDEVINFTVSHKGKPVTSEVLASLYDASLDLLLPHNWPYDFYYSNYGYVNWRNLEAGKTTVGEVYVNGIGLDFPEIPAMFYRMQNMSRRYMARNSASAPVMMESVSEDAMTKSSKSGGENTKKEAAGDEAAETPPIAIRENLNELVFFYPQLKPTAEGKYTIKYKMNDALTRWKLMLLAHDQDMRFGFANALITTQKPLMIKSNKPRVLRHGDELYITANVSNLGEQNLTGVQYKIQLNEAIGGQNLDWAQVGSNKIDLKVGETKGVSWLIKVPALTKVSVLQYTMSVQADGNSDAERDLIPVVPSKILVTETYPFALRENETQNIKFNLPQNSEKAVFEYTADPAWTAFIALPSMTKSTIDNAYTQIENIYINEMGLKILASNPIYKESLKALLAQADPFVSKLQENEELKNLLLQATPFVTAAKDEVNNYNGLAKFQQINNVRNEIREYSDKLAKLQNADGGFGWSEGRPSDVGSTAHVLDLVLKMRSKQIEVKDLGIDINKAAGFVLAWLDKRHLYLKDKNLLDKYETISEIPQLWILKQTLDKTQLDKSVSYQFFIGKAWGVWSKVSINQKPILGKLALAEGKTEVANNIFKFFEQNKVVSRELGTYWEERTPSSFISMGIATHAAIMDYYKEMGATNEVLDEMKIYLIKNKQVNGWTGNSNTSEAVYALLLTGKGKQIELTRSLPIVNINEQLLGAEFSSGKGEAYIKKTIPSNILISGSNDVKVKNTASHIGYGGMYVQYYAEADEIKSHISNPLSLKKELYLEKENVNGKVLVKLNDGDKVVPGDVVVSRLIIESDRDMDYISVTDTRPSGFEPVKDKEGYGFWYYPDYTRDITDYQANYFFYQLPKGKKIIENRIIAVHAGNFSGGIAQLQSQYSPEFSSHSQGVRVKVLSTAVN